MNPSVFSCITDGPVRLRSELKYKTAPVRRLRNRFQTLSVIGLGIPSSLIDGDLAGLMSERLASALSFDKTRQAPLFRQSANRTGFSQALQQGTSPIAPLDSLGLVLTSADVGQATVPALTRATTEGLPLRKMADNRTKPDSLMKNQVEKHSGTTPSGYPDIKRPDFVMTAEQPFLSPETRWSGPPVMIARLRSYWKKAQQSHQAQGAESARLEPHPPGTAPKDQLTELYKPRQNTPWPDIVGKLAARKIKGRRPAAGEAVHGQSVHKKLQVGDHCDIQNVFHIEMPSRQDAVSVDSDRELSDKIADILRRQAIKHGIDIT